LRLVYLADHASAYSDRCITHTSERDADGRARVSQLGTDKNGNEDVHVEVASISSGSCESDDEDDVKPDAEDDDAAVPPPAIGYTRK
jgi:hypothetical protein